MNRNFKLLAISRICSMTADSFSFIVLLWWIDHEGKGNISTIYIWYYLPAVIFALPLAAWVEKNTLQHMMQWANIGRLITYFLFAVFVTDQTYQTVAYGVMFADAFFAMMFYPAAQALIPHIVPEEKRNKANSYLGAFYVIAVIIGQVSAALLPDVIPHIGLLMFIPITLWVISIILTHKIKPSYTSPSNKIESGYTILVKGLTYVKKHKSLSTLFFSYGIFRLLEMSVDMININYLQTTLHKGVQNIAIVNGFYFLGSFLGTLFADRFTITKRTYLFFVIPALSYAIFFALLLMKTALPILLSAFVLVGLVCGVLDVYMIIYIQNQTEESYYARVFGMYGFILNIATLMGTMIVSRLIIYTGGTVSIIFVMVGMLLVAAIQMIKRNRNGI